MQVQIRAKGFEMSSKVHRYIQYRVESAFSRFRGVIRKVEVFVSDENGPRGGIDKACLIKIKLDQHTDFVIKETEKDVHLAVSRLLNRAKQALSRQLKRSKSFARDRIESSLHTEDTFEQPGSALPA